MTTDKAHVRRKSYELLPWNLLQQSNENSSCALFRGSPVCAYSEIGLPAEVYPPKETLIPSSLFGFRVGAMLKTTLRGLGADQGLLETMANPLISQLEEK